jgi:hypothetical protein
VFFASFETAGPTLARWEMAAAGAGVVVMPTVVVGVRRDGAPRIPTSSRRAPGRAYLLVVRALGFFLSLKSRGADFKDKANHILPSFKENGRFRTITWAFKNHRLACFNHIQPSLLLTGP